MLTISLLLLTGQATDGLRYPTWWVAVDLVVGALTSVAVWWRRSYPVAVCTFANLASTVSISSAGAGTLALVSLATRRRWREIVPQAILGLTCAVIAQEFALPTSSSSRLVEYAFAVIIFAMLIAWGLYIGSRRELLASWRSRARLAEQEQQAKVSQARSAERARIAREMHDVLAHRISTVSMYAGALAYRTDLTPEQVRESAHTIEENSRLALTELREVLGVLREGPGDADPEHPQVGPADIEHLIAENADAGMRITYQCRTDLDAVSASTVRTLYRCLQEGLTNARKHAPAASVSVRIEPGRDEGIDLLVANPLPVGVHTPPPPSGLGLIGVAERVDLGGGRYSATRTDDGMFILHIWLPAQTSGGES